MPRFWWPDLEHHLALAREVISCRPSKLQDWEEITAKLSKVFSSEDKPVELRGRGCRERMNRLLDKFKAEDSKSLKQWVTVCIECVNFVGQVDEGLLAVLPSHCCHYLIALYMLQVTHARNLKRTYPHICGNVWPVTVTCKQNLKVSNIICVCMCMCMH